MDDQEFYQLLDKDDISDDIHLFNEKLREWEDYYNYDRPARRLERRNLVRTVAGGKPGLNRYRRIENLH